MDLDPPVNTSYLDVNSTFFERYRRWDVVTTLCVYWEERVRESILEGDLFALLYAEF